MSQSPFKPNGYQSVSPYLIVADPDDLAEFLVRVFGAEQLRRHLRPDGSVMHLEVRLDDSVVMIGGSLPDWEATPSHVHVYVPDAKSAYAAGLAAGGKAVMPPIQKDADDDLRGGFAYPENVTWWVGTQVI